MRRLLVLGLLGLAACPDSSGPEDPPRAGLQATGRIQGQLTPFQGARSQSMRTASSLPPGAPSVRELSDLVARSLPRVHSAPLRMVSTLAPVARATEEERTVPGEVIVRFEERNLTPEQVVQRLRVPGHRAVHKGYASEYLHLVAFEPSDKRKRLTAADTDRLVTRLSTVPGVRFAEPNRRVRSHARPNDNGYAFQWHYPALNLPAAWDVQQGSASVVVAVLDSGIVPHPDLSPNVLPGIDMVSDPATAGDGDGRDDDPTDVGGDAPNGGSSWHGTHVAGTIGAVTNNGSGVAGVTWAVRILPVRVLGPRGGSVFDILAAMVWASGGTVPGLRPNPTPAKVVNLSLGGDGPPQQVVQDVIDERVLNARTVFVIAAGNEAANAATSSPCNQQNVICVGSSSVVARRSSFSNFGAEVDVMAPGGEMREDLNGDGYPDGVLSTSLDAANQPIYTFLQGTSMAAPHVAGVATLLASVRPDIEPAEVERLLKVTAIPAGQCTEGCGAGLVNAQAALRALAGSPVTEPPTLAASTSSLFFNGGGSLPLLVYNEGGGDLQVTASLSEALAGLVSFPGGPSVSVPALSARPLEVTANVAGLAPADYPGTLTLTDAAGGAVSVEVLLRVGGLAAGDAAVVLLFLDEQGEWQSAPELVTVAPAADDYRYGIDAVPRTYYVAASIDDNGDGRFFEEGDRVGFWRNLDSIEPIEVRADEVVDGIDFDLVPLSSVSGASARPGR